MMSESPTEREALEATLCDLCNKVHVGSACGEDILESDDHFILEFEQLPPDEHISKLRKNIQQLRDGRWQATEKAQNYRRKLMAVQHVLPGVGEELRKQKFVFSRLKTQAEQLNRLVQTEVKVIQGLVDDAVKRVAASEKCDGSCVHLRQNYSRLQDEFASLKSLAQSRQERITILEVQLQERGREADAATLHAKHRDMNADQKVLKLQKDNAQMDLDLKSLRKDLIVMQHHLEEERENLEQTQKHILELQGTVEGLNGELSAAHHESEEIRQERNDLEAKVNAMQQDLKKTNAGVKDKVDQEMLKMMQEMDEYQHTVERRLQEDVEKEKRKAQKELEAFITEYRDNETKMMNSMRQTSERHRETIADLQRQIEDLTQQTDEREKLLNTEIAQLNKRLKRAERFGRKSTTPVADQSFLLLEREEKIAELSTELDSLKEQVTQLEELVQKEIEERKNLMEEYSQVKEELLRQKMQNIAGKNSPDPSMNPDMPLNIFRKRTVDKYASYKPSESSGYDMSELAKSAHSYRSLYDDQAQLGAKSSKSSRYSHQQDTNSIAGGPKSSKSVRSSKQDSQATGVLSSKSVRSVQSLLSQMGNRSSQTVRSLHEILGGPGHRSVRDIMGAKSSKSRKSVADDSAVTDTKNDNIGAGTLKKFNSLQQLSITAGEGAELVKPLPPVEQTSVRQSLIQHLSQTSTSQAISHPDKPLPPLDKYSSKQKSNLDTFERLSQPSTHQEENHESPPRQHRGGKVTKPGFISAEASPDYMQADRLHRDKVPPLPRKKSDFSWKVYDSDHPGETSAYVPMIPLPTDRKPKTNWHPSFDTITSKNSTPSVYGATPTSDHQHPLHGPYTNSLTSMSNASRHTEAFKLPGTGQGLREKNSVDLPRMSMMKAVSNNKKASGTASNSAWKIYRNLKVGNKLP